MDKHGKISTWTGRRVYDRKLHPFSPRDAARVTRQALDFPAYNFVSGMEQYADYNWRIFLVWAFKFNFFPMYRMFYTSQEENPDYTLAMEVGRTVAHYLGVPEQVVELGGLINEYILNSRWVSVIRLKPYFASIIWEAAHSVGTIYEEDIYGRKKD